MFFQIKMKNKALWQPTKFVKTKKGWQPNPDRTMVSKGSVIATAAMIAYYEKAILAHANGLLLDLGCGHVPFYAMYESQIEDVVCVDWENSMHKNHFLDIATDLNQNLPLPNDQFDTIICTDVLEHIYKPHGLLSEISRICKPGGKLIVGVPYFYWLHEAPHDYYRYTKYALKQMLADNHFKILSLEAYGGSPEVLADFVAKNLGFSPLLQIIHNYIWKNLLRISFIKKLSKKTGDKFPLGYCVVAERMSSF